MLDLRLSGRHGHRFDEIPRPTPRAHAVSWKMASRDDLPVDDFYEPLALQQTIVRDNSIWLIRQVSEN